MSRKFFVNYKAAMVRLLWQLNSEGHFLTCCRLSKDYGVMSSTSLFYSDRLTEEYGRTMYPFGWSYLENPARILFVEEQIALADRMINLPWKQFLVYRVFGKLY